MYILPISLEVFAFDVKCDRVTSLILILVLSEQRKCLFSQDKTVHFGNRSLITL